ncbi:hypothetical protein Dthio_PD3766 [Desulfonatronospira thiodismutans ASO3-1]|uniref:Uncharacterized protein n=1 Tax=Desulfonatronospira thiodismutans ASO3-1 TaxID=555779 RepID=D6SK99_9BACT|nr:hypothetical protein Dthio_PD3766 [Desulfonatronospira thiodismutans ASO3-1]RQD74211.1 MAG: hypothetical protein D5S03_10965 [Desulfonatronospira sp. MSAO_Bac3]
MDCLHVNIQVDAGTGPGTVPHLFFSDGQFLAVGVGKISAGQSPGLVPVITNQDPLNGYVYTLDE